VGRQGFDVTLQDREQRFIDPAIGRAQALFAKRCATRASARPWPRA
jgi:hypothetical protein